MKLEDTCSILLTGGITEGCAHNTTKAIKYPLGTPTY